MSELIGILKEFIELYIIIKKHLKKQIMGLFSIIKDAGAKVFGIGKTKAEEAADKAADAVAAKLNAEKAAANNLKETISDLDRSEERRVGKECRSRWSTDHEKNKGDMTDNCVRWR